MNNINIYLEGIHERHQLLEVLNMKVDKTIVKKIASAVDEKNPDASIARIKKMIPSGFKPKQALLKVNDTFSGKINEYSQLKNTATQVVKNSLPGVSQKMADMSGTFLAVSTIFTKKADKNKLAKQILKINIKEFVTRCRNFADDVDDDDESKESKRSSDIMDQGVGWTVIIMSVVIALALVKGTMIVAIGTATGISAAGTGVATLALWGGTPIIVGLAVLLGFVFLGVMSQSK